MQHEAVHRRPDGHARHAQFRLGERRACVFQLGLSGVQLSLRGREALGVVDPEIECALGGFQVRCGPRSLGTQDGVLALELLHD